MKKVSRLEIKDALIDILDGKVDSENIYRMTGLRKERCKEIATIVNRLSKEVDLIVRIKGKEYRSGSTEQILKVLKEKGNKEEKIYLRI